MLFHVTKSYLGGVNFCQQFQQGLAPMIWGKDFAGFSFLTFTVSLRRFLLPPYSQEHVNHDTTEFLSFI